MTTTDLHKELAVFWQNVFTANEFSAFFFNLTFHYNPPNNSLLIIVTEFV